MSIYSADEILTESDVEQKFVYRLLTTPTPYGLGYLNSDIRTKPDIRKLTIDKGTKEKLYYPDYAIIVDGVPCAIIEAKAPNEDLFEAFREARLYAAEINAKYKKNINPLNRIVVTNGNELIAGHWDDSSPYLNCKTKVLDPLNPEFEKLANFISKNTLSNFAETVLKAVKKRAIYYKPLQMLGGKTNANQSVGENSFGSNVSLEFKYLFNPDSIQERESIVENAYVKSKRRESHIPAIDKIIRAALPPFISDAKKIEDTSKPAELLKKVETIEQIKNEICLLIGSVGSGKSTFTDFLRLKALPENLKNSTRWININLNKAPLSKSIIYDWIIDETTESIKLAYPDIDFACLKMLKIIFQKEINELNRGRASLYTEDSEKYIDILHDELQRLQSDKIKTLNAIMNYIYKKCKELVVIVLDNCDKRNRDDQLLMFEVATWLKNEMPCMVFLPLRDSTYDQYCNEPPLDTVIKDLVFRIDPPLLQKVVYARLKYALREIKGNDKKFTYYLSNNFKVECDREEVGLYLQSIVTSLFQDKFYRRVITGIAGRNIRKGLEILLDFCKSGHIGEDEIFKLRTSKGDYKLPSHIVNRILLKGKRKYYKDEDSHIKNLFYSDINDALPDPFVRFAILQWLKERFREFGPNRTKGYHKVESLIKGLQSGGHSRNRIHIEVQELARAGCIMTESQDCSVDEEDLIIITSAGFIHLDFLKNINYLSTVSEDTYFRTNQDAKKIANNLIGSGKYRYMSRQADIDNSRVLINYMITYYKDYFLGTAQLLTDESKEPSADLDLIIEYVNRVAESDRLYTEVINFENDYPPGMQIEAQIVSVQTFGLFVEFGLRGHGLVHISTFNNHKCYIEQDYEEGDWIKVEILEYNQNHGRFSLKIVNSD